ncbi:MAG TPA: CU044_2847 family protein [Ktedonobacteraceae bacterium]|jgi:hypothetical protein
MVTEYLPIDINGDTIYVEVQPARRTGSQPTSGRIERVLIETHESFAQAQRTVKHIAAGMVTAIREIDHRLAPEEFEIDIALKFTAEGNVVLTKLGGEAQISIHMTYKHKEQ